LDKRLLIVGGSVRPWVTSAILAGYDVLALDFFAEWDSFELARLAKNREPNGVGAEICQLENFPQLLGGGFDEKIGQCDRAIVCGGLETRTELVRQLENRVELLGPGSLQLSRLLDPIDVVKRCQRIGVRMPETKMKLSLRDDPTNWISKAIGSSGGTAARIACADDVSNSQAGFYFEQALAGSLVSAAFLTSKRSDENGPNTILIGLSRQLVGDQAFGTREFQYCGSIGLPELHDRAIGPQTQEIGEKIATEFGMIGLWGVDFIESKGRLLPIDINPRLTSSMELFEESVRFRSSQAKSLIDAHVLACDGTLKVGAFRREIGQHDLVESVGGQRQNLDGKAILFNRLDRPICIDEELHNYIKQQFDRSFFTGPGAGSSVADVPRPGMQILPRHPILTLRVRAERVDQVEVELRRWASRLYEALEKP